MILTDKQEKGLKIAKQRYLNREPYTVISGYAGTGKSTLVSIIISALGLFPTEVAYISFTGKAALVLSNKGCPNAMTAHKLLYESRLTENGTYYHFPKRHIDSDYKLIVVDEVSMLPQEMWELLLRHKIHIIALGDPGQLPPVSGTNDILQNPHIFLDEIVRQAMDNEIIRLSLDIRNGKLLNNYRGKDVCILSKDELNTGMLEWADQILCGTNNKRKEINQAMRKLKGFEDEGPQEGDKLICLKNYWEEMCDSGNPLVNGSIGYLKNPYKDTVYISERIAKIPGGNEIPIIVGDFVTENEDIFQNLRIDKNMVITGKKCIEGPVAYKILTNKRSCDLVPMEFDYGYAITTHRAQGSQWNKVLVVEERFPFSPQEHSQWLYTACTRPVEKLVLIKQ